MYRTRETPEPWLSRKRSHDRQVSYLDSVLEPPRCRLARALYMEPQIREAHSTLLVLQNQAHNALAKPSRTPGNLPKRCSHPTCKFIPVGWRQVPPATRASWRWHPPRRCVGAPTAARSAGSGRRATSPPARRAAGSFSSSGETPTPRRRRWLGFCGKGGAGGRGGKLTRWAVAARDRKSARDPDAMKCQMPSPPSSPHDRIVPT